jgi:hypothetical protein
MIGGGDPENRGPMRWDLVQDDNPELVWIKKLIELHQQNRALRLGNSGSSNLIACWRLSDTQIGPWRR